MRGLAYFSILLCMMAHLGFTQNPLAPQVRVSDLSGTPHDLLAPAAKGQVVIFWQPDHPRARVALCEVAKMAAAQKNTPLVAVVSGVYARDEIEQATANCALKPAVLLDAKREAFSAYHVIALPTVLVLDSEKRVLLRLAGFGSDASSQLQESLDAIHGRKPIHAEVPLPEPHGAVGRLEMARRLLKLGMANKAEEILMSLTKELPGYRPAWVTLGYKRVADGQPDQAKDCFDKALTIDGKQMDVAPGLAWVYWQKGDRERTAQWVSAADPKDPNFRVVGTLTF